MQMLRKERIMNFIKNEKLFSNWQYGFILGGSTQLEYIRQWTESLDEGHSIDCAYMDYAKTFDTVPHRRKIYKLLKCEINSKVVQVRNG